MWRLQANKLACGYFLDTDRRLEVPGRRHKTSLLWAQPTARPAATSLQLWHWVWWGHCAECPAPGARSDGSTVLSAQHLSCLPGEARARLSCVPIPWPELHPSNAAQPGPGLAILLTQRLWSLGFTYMTPCQLIYHDYSGWSNNLVVVLKRLCLSPRVPVRQAPLEAARLGGQRSVWVNPQVLGLLDEPSA